MTDLIQNNCPCPMCMDSRSQYFKDKDWGKEDEHREYSPSLFNRNSLSADFSADPEDYYNE